MKKIIIGISLLILATAIGLFTYFNIDTDKELTKLPKQQQKEENKDTIENKNNKELQKQKCNTLFCIEGLSIAKQAGIYSITASLKNTSKTNIEDTAFNLVFTSKDGQELKKTYYLLNVEIEKEMPLEIHFKEEDILLMDVNNYKIEEASLEEYNLAKSLLEN